MPSGPDDMHALGFIRVLDLSENVAGQFCCRMLADHGADVTLVEPPAGSALRAEGPFRETADGQRESLLFEHLNLGKKSVALDPETEDGMALFAELAAAADVIVAPAGFDKAALHRINPNCIVNIVSPFGDDGPKRHWRGAEIIYQAMSGMMNQNGRRDREPLYGVGQRASYCTGVAAYSAIVAALIHREATGETQDLAVDIAHTAASMMYPLALQYSYNGTFERRGSTGLPLIEVETANGWISIWIRADKFEATCRGLGMAEMITDPRFADPNDRKTNFGTFVEEVQKRVRELDGEELVRSLQSDHGVAAARCYRPSQLGPDARHLAERDYWKSIQTDDGERFVLGPQFRMSRTPARRPTPAPKLGQANARSAG